MAARMINARAETIAEKPAFRSAFKYRRCLIPANGFYQWQKLNGKKQAYHIYPTDGKPLAFVGLWEHWQSPDGSEIESCTILTTTANELMATLHDRMPVILDPADYEAWLLIDSKGANLLHHLLRPGSWPLTPSATMSTAPSTMASMF